MKLTNKCLNLKLFLVLIFFTPLQIKGQETDEIVCSKTIWGGPAGKTKSFKIDKKLENAK
jgi:hypothetical protein